MRKVGHHEVLTIEDLLELGDDADYWLVRNLLPRIGVTIIYGHGATFKSTFVFDLCVAIASEGLLLQHFAIEQHGPVLLVSTESSKYANRDRLLAHIRARETHSTELLHVRKGKMLLPTNDRVKVHFCHKPFDLEDAQDRKALRKIIEEVKPVLVVLDPLDSFLSGDENSAKETKPFRREVDKLKNEFETSFVIIHHSTKSPENPTIRGNSAWRGWADTALFFHRLSVPVDGRNIAAVRVFADKQREGADGELFFFVPNYDELRRMTTFKVFTSKAELAPDNVSHNHLVARIYQHLTDQGPKLQTALREELGVSHKRLTAALQELVSDGFLANDVPIQVPTSPDGSRCRTTYGWRVTKKTSLLDMASRLIRGDEITNPLLIDDDASTE